MRLPRSDQRLALRDIQAAQVKATSLKTMLVLGAVFTASAVIQAISLAFIIGIDVGARRHLTVGSSQLLLFCLMLLQGGLAVLSFKRTISRYVQGKLTGRPDHNSRALVACQAQPNEAQPLGVCSRGVNQ
jgi:hypothetical protein